MRSPSGLGGEADADGVADAGQQQRGEAGGGGDEALGAHAGFGEAEVQGVVAAGGEIGVDVDEIAHAADLGGKDDLVLAQAVALGGLGGIERADHHGFHHDVAGGQRAAPSGLFSSIMRVSRDWSSEPQLTPMRTGF